MSDNNDEFGAFLVGFIVGGLSGAVVALLFAPQTGEETRALIKDKSIELRDKAQQTAEEAFASAEHAAAEARTRAEELAKVARQRADELAVEVRTRSAEAYSSAKERGQAIVKDVSERGKEVYEDVRERGKTAVESIRKNRGFSRCPRGTARRIGHRDRPRVAAAEPARELGI